MHYESDRNGKVKIVEDDLNQSLNMMDRIPEYVPQGNENDELILKLLDLARKHDEAARYASHATGEPRNIFLESALALIKLSKPQQKE